MTFISNYCAFLKRASTKSWLPRKYTSHVERLDQPLASQRIGAGKGRRRALRIRANHTLNSRVETQDHRGKAAEEEDNVERIEQHVF